MNRSRSLTRLVQWADERFEEFELTAGALKPPFDPAGHDQARYLAIEAPNTWEVFLRTYFLASATGAWLADGTRITGHGRTMRVEHAVTTAVHAIDPSLKGHTGPWTQSQEPNWLDPGIVLRLLNSHGLSNATGFSNALAAGTRANEALLTYRNFVAHRGRGSALKVRTMMKKVGVGATGDPIELPFYRARNRPVTVFSDWVIELRSIIQLSPN